MRKHEQPRTRPQPIEQPPPPSDPPKRGPAPGTTYQMDPPVVPKPPAVKCPIDKGGCGSTEVNWRANKITHMHDGKIITWQRVRCVCGKVRIERGEEPL